MEVECSKGRAHLSVITMTDKDTFNQTIGITDVCDR